MTNMRLGINIKYRGGDKKSAANRHYVLSQDNLGSQLLKNNMCSLFVNKTSAFPDTIRYAKKPVMGLSNQYPSTDEFYQ